MKTYTVNYSPNAEKIIEKMDNSVKSRIKNWIDKYLVGCENPRYKGRALTGNLAGYWRYRVGDYRIIAEIQDEKVVILVINVDKRNDIYKSNIL